MRITQEALEKTERAEKALFDMGFSDFRVRMKKDGSALVQITASQTKKAKNEWAQINRKLLAYYPAVRLDEHPR